MSDGMHVIKTNTLFNNNLKLLTCKKYRSVVFVQENNHDGYQHVSCGWVSLNFSVFRVLDFLHLFIYLACDHKQTHTHAPGWLLYNTLKEGRINLSVKCIREGNNIFRYIGFLDILQGEMGNFLCHTKWKYVVFFLELRLSSRCY
jgi:hypothetical protein